MHRYGKTDEDRCGDGDKEPQDGGAERFCGQVRDYGEIPGLIEYPKYYLDKQFDYLICGIGGSFDAKGEEVMNHGGITIDEVIVPFIKIKAVDNNG